VASFVIDINGLSSMWIPFQENVDKTLLKWSKEIHRGNPASLVPKQLQVLPQILAISAIGRPCYAF
jgi:hypothetical protein